MCASHLFKCCGTQPNDHVLSEFLKPTKERKEEVLRDLRQLRILDRGMVIPEKTDDITRPASIIII